MVRNAFLFDLDGTLVDSVYQHGVADNFATFATLKIDNLLAEMR